MKNLTHAFFICGWFFFMVSSGASTISLHAQDSSCPAELWFHAKNIEVSGCYAQDAVHVKPDAQVIQGNANIVQHLISNDIAVDSVWVIWETNAWNNYVYRIEGIQTDKGLMKSLVVYHDTTHERSLDFLALTTEHQSQIEAIDERRKDWMDYCNAHDVEGLITKVYHPNTVYYNHDKPVIGTEAMIPTYSYMARDDYNLTLTPLHIESISDDLVYEIGQCSGTYGGKYVIVWKKGKNGVWTVLLDSNI